MNRGKKIGLTFIKNEITRSFWINRFLNKLTVCGKKEKTEKMFYMSALFLKKRKINIALSTFYVIELLKPVVYTKPYTSRGKVKLVPSQIGPEEQYNRAITWLTGAIKFSKEKTLAFRFIRELFKIILYRRSRALRYKKKLYKIVVKNRTLANFKI